jgi:hypothetical protein
LQGKVDVVNENDDDDDDIYIYISVFFKSGFEF